MYPKLKRNSSSSSNQTSHLPKILLFPILLIFLCLLQAGPPLSAATFTVTVGDNFFNPSTINVNQGDTVVWNWTGFGPHSTTSGTIVPIMDQVRILGILGRKPHQQVHFQSHLTQWGASLTSADSIVHLAWWGLLMFWLQP